MSFIQKLVENKLEEAKEELFNRLNIIVVARLEEAKEVVANNVFEEFEELREANSNIIKMGRV